MFVWEKGGLAAGSSREGPEPHPFLVYFNDKPWGSGLGFRTGLLGLGGQYFPDLPKLLHGALGQMPPERKS